MASARFQWLPRLYSGFCGLQRFAGGFNSFQDGSMGSELLGGRVGICSGFMMVLSGCGLVLSYGCLNVVVDGRIVF